MRSVYALVGKWRRHLDVRVLLPSADGIASPVAHLPDLDTLLLAPSTDAQALLNRLNAERTAAGLLPMRGHELPEWPLSPAGRTEEREGYDNQDRHGKSSDRLGAGGRVCVGGTFDRLHSGHKLLLTRAALLARRRLLIGVTDASLLRSKHLRELVQPLAFRASSAEEFVRSVRPGLDCAAVALADPFGPAATDGRLETLVASAETAGAALAANGVRAENGLSPLVTDEAPLLNTPPARKLGGQGGPSASARRASRTNCRPPTSAAVSSVNSAGMRRSPQTVFRDPGPAA